jgi:hypothetical protein
MTPTHVMVQQCDGSCHQFGQACIPTRTVKRSVPVIFSRCGIHSGLCEKDCASLEVEEHVGCACACQLTARDCPPQQEFRPELCSCQCRDLPAKQACLDAGRPWHEATCSCSCLLEDGQEEEECSNGWVFDREHSCSCVAPQETPLELPDKAVSPHHSSTAGEGGSSDGPFPSLEVVIIAALLVIILILLSLVFSLVIRIQKMNRRAKQQSQRQMSNNNSSTQAEVLEEPSARRTAEEDEEEQLMIYNEVNCSTPSSGFYSEMGQGGGVERSCVDQLALLQQQQQQRHQQQAYHQQQQQIYQQQRAYDSRQLYQPISLPHRDFDALYQSAEAVRLNKKQFAIRPQPSPLALSAGVPPAMPDRGTADSNLETSSDEELMYGFDRSMQASFPIDEAVRMLQFTGNR